TFDAQRFATANSATPIFGPAIRLTAPEPAEPMPPIEAFNWRPTWPAVSGVQLGEITVYREYYSDWQRSNTAGRGYVNDYLYRSFQSYRTGIIVK
ncbi:MAG: hypothetical protein PHU85_16365, partial [Phycisphaerae bacterium]|nr:hypothetical protein [Phycisphaerae bacterium]